MLRTFTLLSLLVAAVLAPRSAQACGARPVQATKKKEVARAAPAQAAPGSLLRDVDSAIAGKCNCTSAADCTCKKGSCKCPHCAPKARPMFESLQDRGAPLRIPANARRDATAGAFI